MLLTATRVTFWSLSRSVGNAYRQCCRGVWDACWGAGLNYWICGRLLRLRKIIRSTSTPKTRNQPRSWNGRNWMPLDGSFWKWMRHNFVQWKHWSHRNHEGKQFVLAICHVCEAVYLVAVCCHHLSDSGMQQYIRQLGKLPVGRLLVAGFSAIHYLCWWDNQISLLDKRSFKTTVFTANVRYSILKTFVFAVNNRNRHSIIVWFIQGLKEKNKKLQVIITVCRLP